MLGFTVAELQRPALLGRLFGRKPHENAFIEIRNLLAQRKLAEVTAADIINILSEYEVPADEATRRLKELYETAVRHVAHDKNLSPQDLDDLRHLRYVLSLEDADARGVETEVLREFYREALREALQDQHLSDEEKARLEGLAKNFGIPEEVRDAVYRDEVVSVVQEAFNAAIADRRLTREEENRLAGMTENLGVKMKHDDKTLRVLERYRLLAQIENGQLPEVQPPIRLPRGEPCHAEFPCNLHELRSRTKAVGYHGPTGRIRIMKGLSWRYGYLNFTPVTTEELRQIDTGTLYITNKRLLFNGARRNVSIQLKKIVHFTLFKDGIQVEKDSGRDQYFLGSGDLELVGAILEAALKQVGA